MTEKLPKIHTLPETPDWMHDWVRNHSGLVMQVIQPEELSDLTKAKLFVWEDSIKLHSEYLRKAVDTKTVEGMVVFIFHFFRTPTIDVLDDDMIESLKYLKNHTKMEIWTEGYTALDWQVPVRNVSTHEHGLSNYFNLLLALHLDTKRKPIKDFYMAVVPSDPVRKAVVNALVGNSVCDNSVLLTGGNAGVRYRTTGEWLSTLANDLGQGNHVDALQGFGNGLPNMPAYEQCLCEVVLETAHDQSGWHLSEKTFRPICLNVPTVYLASRQQASSLLDLGYKLHDNEFYQVWHSDKPLDIKTKALLTYLAQIKDNEQVRTEIEQVAQHNFDWFWNQRKLSWYSNIHKGFENFVGANHMVSQVYGRLDS